MVQLLSFSSLCLIGARRQMQKEKKGATTYTVPVIYETILNKLFITIWGILPKDHVANITTNSQPTERT